MCSSIQRSYTVANVDPTAACVRNNGEQDETRHGTPDTLRWVCYHVLSSSWFEACIILVILANVVTLVSAFV